MSHNFRKRPIKKHLSFYLLSLFLLPFTAECLTACGMPDADQSNLPAMTQDTGLQAPTLLPSENHLRAFTTVQNLADENFTPTAAQDIPRNSLADLSVPTYVTKVEDTYFIVDCYHDQVIYHDNLNDPLTDWQILTNEIDKGHTLASDGTVYLVDDTEGNRVLVFEKKEGAFYHTQTLDEVGNRPHYIVYDALTDTFYVKARKPD